MKLLFANLILAPLVFINYRLRRQGKLHDQWYWADELIIKLGMMRYVWCYE